MLKLLRPKPALVVAALAALAVAPARAQQAPPAQERSPEAQLPDKPQAAVTPAGSPEQSHRFFDRKNHWLFAGVATARALDFVSTKNFRSRGRDEILLTNDIVDNTPAFVAIQAGATLASVGVSYWLHRTGHHKAERWVSVVHISVGSVGAVRNFSLQSAPTAGSAPSVSEQTVFARRRRP